jgi:Protein kinase domain
VPARRWVPVAAPVAANALVGLVLGRYRALRPLGSGGSGSVWLALDEHSGLEVALKVVGREGKAGARAEREAAVAARLRHERCQRTYQLASDEHHVYIAYEYIPGCNLRQAMRAGELDDATAIEASAQVLEALAHAHSRGIVHRDVKPANVLLAEGDGVSIRLLDFGLAQLHGADPLTEHGDVPGTLAYISPERLRGENGGPPSDVWAVGVMLWEALAGWHPFWAPSLTATAKKIKAGAPPLDSARRDLPGPLLATVDRALERDPAARPDAHELAERLRRTSVARRRRPQPAVPGPAAVRQVVPRLVPALLAALYTGWFAATFPFFPSGWAIGLSLAAAALTLAHERAGLALALAAPVFPLGNLSGGLALLYAGGALAWLLLHWRRPRWALLPVWGPLLAPLSLLGLLPLAVQPAPAAARRALHAGTGVLLAALVAGVEGWRLPFADAGDPAPALELAQVERATAAGRVLATAVVGRPHLLAVALLLAAAAALLPVARRHGHWGLAVFAAGFLALALLPQPTLAVLPLVACVWATCASLAVVDARRRR